MGAVRGADRAARPLRRRNVRVQLQHLDDGFAEVGTKYPDIGDTAADAEVREDFLRAEFVAYGERHKRDRARLADQEADCSRIALIWKVFTWPVCVM